MSEFSFDNCNETFMRVDDKPVGLAPLSPLLVVEVEPRGLQVSGIALAEFSMHTLFVELSAPTGACDGCRADESWCLEL